MAAYTNVDAVVFDLDSTLCVSEQSDEAIRTAVFDRAGVEPFFASADVRAVDPADLPTAESDVEFYENLYRAVADDVGGGHEHAAALAEATVEVVDPTAVRFRDGAREALAHARERYDVGLITNGGEETQTAKLETLGIDDAFETAVFCDPAAGVEPKPSPVPFRTALRGLDAPPEKAIYVGDSLGGDVAGAHSVGMQSAWVPLDRPASALPERPDPEPTHWLESMAELPTVL